MAIPNAKEIVIANVTNAGSMLELDPVLELQRWFSAFRARFIAFMQREMLELPERLNAPERADVIEAQLQDYQHVGENYLAYIQKRPYHERLSFRADWEGCLYDGFERFAQAAYMFFLERWYVRRQRLEVVAFHALYPPGKSNRTPEELEEARQKAQETLQREFIYMPGVPYNVDIGRFSTAFVEAYGSG